ncbi:MAG: hypothetical protein ACR2NF_00380 [Pirellulales bacterium]
MANTVLGLSMRISASADGMREGVNESEKLLKKLSREADVAAKGFDGFKNEMTGELPAAMSGLGDTLGELSKEFLDGKMSAEEFRASFKNITSEAQEMSKAFAEGERLAKSLRSEEERMADELENIARLEKLGAVSVETANRARDKATGANKRAADAASAAATQQRKAAQIIQQTLTPMERYGQEVDELDNLLREGLLTQTQYNRGVAQSQAAYDSATKGANSFDSANKKVKKSTMEFNELSGILGMLPGQFGAVASRISSFASAGQGVSKLFEGGLKGAIGNIGSSLAGLMNPATIAVAAFAAVGLGISALVKGLVALEDRVEKSMIEATKLGTSFAFMQQLQVAAERTGESVETLRVGFTALLRNIDAARNGNEMTTKAFADLGISMEDLQTKTPEEIFKMAGEALNTIEDPALRTAAALKTVGENGGRLQPAFRALKEAGEDLVRFNAQLDDFQTAQITDMGKAFDDLSLATTGISQALLTPFSGMIESISAGLAAAFATLSRNVGAILDAFSPLFTVIGIVIEQFLAFGSILSNLMGAVLEPFAAMGNNQNEILLKLGDAWRAVTTAINDAITYVRQIIRSLFDFRGAGEGLSPIIEGIGNVITRVGRIFQQIGKNIASAISGMVQRFQTLIETSPLFAAFATVIKSAFDGVMTVINGFVSGFATVVNSVLSFIEYLVGVEQELPEVEVQVNDEQLVAATKVAENFYDEITTAVDQVKDLGQEGFAAALKYQEQLQMIADLIAEGELTEEEGQRGIDAATKAYEQQVDTIERRQEAEKKAAEEAQKAADKAIENHRKRVEAMLEEKRIQDEFGGNKERFEADKNVTALQSEIEQTEKAIAEARAKGDSEALAALNKRLATLDQLRQQEADVASGQAAAAKEIDKALQSASKAAESAIAKAAQVGPETGAFIEDFKETMAKLSADLQLNLIDPAQFDAAAEAARKDFDKRVNNAKKIADLRDKLNEESAKIEADRLASLEKRIQEPLEISDLRDDASIIFDAVSGREDPAIEEYRKQLDKLNEIKTEIAKTNMDVVEIA